MKIRTDLLRVLAGHLISGKLGHESFDFSHYNHGIAGRFAKNNCGTNGCAIGECPVLWPDQWQFNEGNKMPSLRDKGIGPERSGREFFGLTQSQFYHLFVPKSQDTDYGEMLSNESTKEQVAANIIKFCKVAEKGEMPDRIDINFDFED